MFGYLDAGTGSMIAAAVAGGAAGVAVLARMYGNRLLGIFSRKHRAKADEARAELVGTADDDHA
jgi:hypothetical protein